MLVLFDGTCGFCDASVQWVLKHDSRGVFQFSALQGDTARGIRATHPDIPDDLDSIVLVDGDRVRWRSDAIFRICQELDGGWRVLGWFRFLPRSLTDFFYGLFASHRHHVFGRIDACTVPAPAQRARFLP